MSDTTTLNEPQIPEDVNIHDPAFVRDPFTACNRLRHECPLARSNQHGGFWLMTRYEDVRAAAIDWRSYTSSVAGVTAIPVITPRTEPQLPIEMDPPKHARYRALVNPLFAPERVENIAPRIRDLAASIIGRMAAKGAAEAVTEFCVPVAITSLAAFTDVPLADSERWVGWITRMFDVGNPAAGTAAGLDLVAYIDELIAARRTSPTGDFISMLMAAEIDGERLDDGQIRSFVTVVFGAGFETTADALSVMLHWLAENPEGMARLSAEPALIPTAVEEFLRYASPVQIFGRNAVRDISMHERQVQAGEIVALGFGSANRDPDVFEAPGEMRLDRRPNRHLAFGAGPHLCAGAGVARMELAVTLETLIEAGTGLAPDPAAAPHWKARGDRRGLSNLPLLIKRKKTD